MEILINCISFATQTALSPSWKRGRKVRAP